MQAKKIIFFVRNYFCCMAATKIAAQQLYADESVLVSKTFFAVRIAYAHAKNYRAA
jgi:hypothetical protein